jgi:MFS family permease
MLNALRPGRAAARPASPGGGPADSPLGRSFYAFQCAVICSDLADGVFKIVMPLLALGLSHSATAVSAVGLAVRLPWLIVALPVGIVVDRRPPRAVMRVAAAARLPVVLAVGWLALVHLIPVAVLVVAAFLVASAGIFVDVSAQSLLPRLVSRARLPTANARLFSTEIVAAQLVGPAIGGYAVALGAGWGPGTAAALYLGSLGALALVTLPAVTALIHEPASASTPTNSEGSKAPETDVSDGLPAQDPTSGVGGIPASRQSPFRELIKDLREGISYFSDRRDLSRLALIASMNNLAYSMCFTILPLWIVKPGRLDLSTSEYGLLLGALALGGLSAGIAAKKVLKRHFLNELLLRWGGAASGLMFLAIAIPSAIVVSIALVIYGALAMLWNLVVVSYRQTTVPRQIFGRVNAAYRWVTWGVIPFGSLLAWGIDRLAGTGWVFIVAGLLPVIGGSLLALRPFPKNGPESGGEDTCTSPS